MTDYYMAPRLEEFIALVRKGGRVGGSEKFAFLFQAHALALLDGEKAARLAMEERIDLVGLALGVEAAGPQLAAVAGDLAAQTKILAGLVNEWFTNAAPGLGKRHAGGGDAERNGSGEPTVNLSTVMTAILKVAARLTDSMRPLIDEAMIRDSLRGDALAKALRGRRQEQQRLVWPAADDGSKRQFDLKIRRAIQVEPAMTLLQLLELAETNASILERLEARDAARRRDGELTTLSAQAHLVIRAVDALTLIQQHLDMDGVTRRTAATFKVKAQLISQNLEESFRKFAERAAEERAAAGLTAPTAIELWAAANNATRTLATGVRVRQAVERRAKANDEGATALELAWIEEPKLIDAANAASILPIGSFIRLIEQLEADHAVNPARRAPVAALEAHGDDETDEVSIPSEVGAVTASRGRGRGRRQHADRATGLTCFGCDVKGHLAADCPTLKAMPEERRKRIVAAKKAKWLADKAEQAAARAAEAERLSGK